MGLQEFITDYFINPMKYPDNYAPYNIYNTAAYAIIGILAAYMIYKLLIRKKIAIDGRFYYAVIPFVLFGGILRVITDSEMLPRSVNVSGMTIYPFITPGIYILIAIILGISLFVSQKISSKEGAKKTAGNIGISLAILASLILLLGNYRKMTGTSILLFAAIPVLAFVSAGIFEFAKRFYKTKTTAETGKLERFAVFSQMLDGSATFIGVQFAGYSEQHVVANALFDAFGGPIAFYAVKLLFVLFAVYILRKESNNQNEHVYLLLLISILGLAPGMRDALRMLFGV